MKLKPTVRVTSVGREIWFALGVAEAIYRSIASTEVTVTSLSDGQHGPKSLHPLGKAADLRTRTLTVIQGDQILRLLKLTLEPMGFDVVDERDKPNAPHFHIEFQPKGNEKFYGTSE